MGWHLILKEFIYGNKSLDLNSGIVELFVSNICEEVAHTRLGKACNTQNLVGTAYFTLIGKFHLFTTTDRG